MISLIQPQDGNISQENPGSVQIKDEQLVYRLAGRITYPGRRLIMLMKE